MILNAVMLGLFGISMIGYVIYLQKKLEINVEFIPIISISIISVILFVGGILNILLTVSIIVFILGICLFILEMITTFKNKENILGKFITPGTIFFAIFSIYFLVMLKEQRLIEYDNFSHWGLIVKNMLNDNSLPNFENVTIQFSSYPPGSALYIYYFCLIVGKSEGLALFAQMVIILSGLLSLFSFSSFSIVDIPKLKHNLCNNIILNIITIFASLYLLKGPSIIHNLLVDTLISIVGITIFALIYFYFDSPTKILVPVTFLASFLILIKNSGMFFAFFALLIYYISYYKVIKQKHGSFVTLVKSKYYLLIPIGTPLILYYLWTKHVSMVFPMDSLSKHAMSIENYIANFNNKTSSEIDVITHNFFDTFFDSVFLRQFILIILVSIVMVVLSYALNKSIDKRLVTVSSAIFLIFALYNLGLWLMYLISMPTGEALNLAGYHRYMATIMHYLVGISFVSSIYFLKKLSFARTFIVSSSIIFVFLIFLMIGEGNTQEIKSIFQNKQVEKNGVDLTITDIDTALTNLSPNQFISKGSGEQYLIYLPIESNGNGYEQYYVRYRLLQNAVSLVNNTEEMRQKLWNSDFLVITKVTDEVVRVFDQFSIEEPQIGTYKVDKNNKLILNKVIY